MCKDPFKKLMSQVKSSAKSAEEKGQKFGRVESLKIEIDAEYLKEIYHKYGGCCPYYLSFGVTKYVDLTLAWDTFNILSPSVDRIHSHLGYIKGNVVITHRGTNIAKSNINLDAFLQQLKFFNNLNDKTMKQFKPLLDFYVELGTMDALNTAANIATKIQLNETPSNKSKGISKTTSSKKAVAKRQRNRDKVMGAIKQFDPTITTLKPASEVFGLKKSSFLYSRSESKVDELVNSGSIYFNENNSKDNWLVDTSIVTPAFVEKLAAA